MVLPLEFKYTNNRCSVNLHQFNVNEKFFVIPAGDNMVYYYQALEVIEPIKHKNSTVNNVQVH